MDPNAALAEIRRLTRIAQDGTLPTDLADLLAGQVDDLDEWLSTGGFLPTAWER